MSTHKVCFCREIRKYRYFLVEKSALSRPMDILSGSMRSVIPMGLFSLFSFLGKVWYSSEYLGEIWYMYIHEVLGII